MTETYAGREIVIKVKGFERKELMTLITDDFDEMHNKFDNVKIKKWIPCNCSNSRKLDTPHFYEYEDLVTRKKPGKERLNARSPIIKT